VMRQLPKSRVTGLRSTSFRTSSKLRSNIHGLIAPREATSADLILSSPFEALALRTAPSRSAGVILFLT
jgi:hypothetical protein